MSNLEKLSSYRNASGASVKARFAPVVLFLASAFGLLASGCGGGTPVYVAGPPCYGYGCYTYGYGAISTVPSPTLLGSSGNGAPAGNAQREQPVGLAVDSSGNLYIADRASNALREVAASAASTPTVSPENGLASAGSRPAFARLAGSRFTNPSAVAVDPSGNLYVADQASSTVSRVAASTGAVAIVAGSAPGYSGDKGQATNARLNHPSGMALDRSGNLFIADTLNHRVRKIAASNGRISTVAGDGTPGYAGDGGPAAAAQLSHPTGVAADSDGNLYIADAANAAIRKVDARTGIISTIAGNGIVGFSGDGASAAAAQLSNPQGIAVDAYGNLFIADTGNQRIREVAARTGFISTVAGGPNQGYSGDGGPSSRAELNDPRATAVDTSGTLYIADFGNGVIRKVLPDRQTAPERK